MSQTQDVEGDIRRFVAEQVLDDPQAHIDAHAPLLQGLLDSWALMQLISFLEERFDVSVQPDDVVDEHFGTIAAVTAFVAGKRGAAGR